MAPRIVALLFAALCSAPLAVQAQTPDEPGMEAPPIAPPPATSPRVAPPPATAAPPPPPPAATRPAQAVDSETGTSWVDEVRRTCPERGTCEMVPALLRHLAQPGTAVEAAKALGESKDPRAVAPLLNAAQYGPSEAAQKAAQAALAGLALIPDPRKVLLRSADDDPDSALRAAARAALDAETPAPEEGSDGPAQQYSLLDPDAGRMIYGNSAFTRRKGTWNWTLFNIAFWSIDYGVSDNIQIGIESAPPILILALFPNIKAAWQVHPWIRLGFRFMAGGFWPYLEEMNDDNFHLFVWGGGPILTIGGEDLNFTVSLPAYGLAVGEDEWVYNTGSYYHGEEEMNYEYFWMVLPSIGASWRVHKRVKLNIELYAPINESELSGKLWLLMYGLRVVGERIYGDISFIMPLFEHSGEVLRYIPLGAPFLAFGFQW